MDSWSNWEEDMGPFTSRSPVASQELREFDESGGLGTGLEPFLGHWFQSRPRSVKNESCSHLGLSPVSSGTGAQMAKPLLSLKLISPFVGHPGAEAQD